jgi:transcription antitermination factor NusG
MDVQTFERTASLAPRQMLRSPQWFAVYTNPNSEGLANYHLNRVGYRTWYPQELVTIRHARRVSTEIRPYFARYIFVQLQPGQDTAGVNSAVGVNMVVRSLDGPLPIPDVIIRSLMRQASTDGVIGGEGGSRTSQRHAIGERVAITGGPLEGLLGTIAEVDKSPDVRIWIESFGREVLTIVRAEWVEEKR